MIDRARKAYRSPTFWLAITVAVLLYAMWQDQKERPVIVRNAQVQFCENVSKPAAMDAIERDSDLQGIDSDLSTFAQAAALARRAEGQEAVARKYEQVVASAKERANHAQGRQESAKKRQSVPCEERFPEP